DLAGPKLRTGTLPPGPIVHKLRPQRDAFGYVIEPARLLLRAHVSSHGSDDGFFPVTVDSEWLKLPVPGDRLYCIDARRARRTLEVVRADRHGILAESRQAIYLTPETELHVMRDDKLIGSGPLAGLPPTQTTLHLACGQMLRLVRPEDDMRSAGDWREGETAAISCTLPEVFSQVMAGERIFFDDGRIGGTIREAHADHLLVEITQARATGEKLAADKGINLPDSHLNLPALTEKDLDDLAHVARLADMVGLSFVQRRADIEALHEHLRSLGADDLGLVLKIETRRAFENLPELLFSAMQSSAVGVMIARGDLAIECGFERLAEVQEEILWAAEAAHLPTIWATQVLETLARTGLPSRAEITDAAMGERAECVMLNKGSHIIDAIRVLDDILRRMQAHQCKKRPLLRALHAWSLPVAPNNRATPELQGRQQT
ncbi:MAG: pyruvate kinase, partial [Pseudomonadota bacterium]|nr:pyruvate kinase [Pseudomonadota bacterium]